MNSKDKRTGNFGGLSVTDLDTGRTGRLVKESGYVVGGQYVNPGYRIEWDDAPPLEGEES